jgi:hypothetical protein
VGAARAFVYVRVRVRVRVCVCRCVCACVVTRETGPMEIIRVGSQCATRRAATSVGRDSINPTRARERDTQRGERVQWVRKAERVVESLDSAGLHVSFGAAAGRGIRTSQPRPRSGGCGQTGEATDGGAGHVLSPLVLFVPLVLCRGAST